MIDIENTSIGNGHPETGKLAELINHNSAAFEINDIINPNKLIQVKRTGFTWSEVSGTLSLATNHKYVREALSNPNIAGVITKTKFMSDFGNANKFIIFSDLPAELFYTLHNHGIHLPYSQEKAVNHFISPTAQIAESAIIKENVHIGNNVAIHDGCIIFPNTILSDGCEIHPGSLIGTSGFFSKNIHGKKLHIKHYGGVRLGNNCIIHANSNVSRSVNSDEFTELATGVHVGIGSNIAHDCKIGKNSDISAGTILAGRVKVGEDCWIGAGSLLSNAIKIGDRSKINIGSVVIKDVEAGSTLSGNFAYDHKLHLRELLI